MRFSRPIIKVDNPLHYGIWIAIAICLQTIVAVVSVVSIALSSYEIAGAFSLGSYDATWVSTATLCCISISIPLSSYLADTLGDKRVFFTGAFLIGFGLLMCGTAQSFSMLILGRCCSGIGSGLFFPLSLTLLSQLFDESLRALVLTLYVGVGFGGGYMTGGILGGYIAQNLSWQLSFLFSLPLCISSLAIVAIVMKEERRPCKKMSYFNLLLFVTATLSLLFGLTNYKASWNSEGIRNMYCGLLFIISGGSFLLFFLRERVAERQVVEFSLFHHSSFRISTFLIFVIGALYFGSVLIMTKQLVLVYNFPKNIVGWSLAYFGMSLGLMSVITGAITRYIDVKIPVIAGCFVLFLSCYMQLSLSLYSPIQEITSVLVVRGLGVGMCLGTVTALGLSDISYKSLENGAVILSFFRQMGAAYVTAILSIVYAFRYEHHITLFRQNMILNGSMQKVLMSSFDFAKNSGIANMESKKFGDLLVSGLIEKQAGVAALNDAIYLLGVAILVSGIYIAGILLLRFRKKSKPS